MVRGGLEQGPGGRIVQGWNDFDFGTMNMQIGR
jgi:hypothetical protein